MNFSRGLFSRIGVWFSVLVLMCSCFPEEVKADAFDGYTLNGSFTLPIGSATFDVTPSGLIVTIANDDVYVETSANARTFALVGVLPGADIPAFGAAFIRVSPDGTQIAVGNNGGASGVDYEVGIFDLDTLVGQWFIADHFDGVWIDSVTLALAAGDFSTGQITLLDTTSVDPNNPSNPTVISNIGGASGGVTIDLLGNLYTGNGFMSAGPSGTGAVKAFPRTQWEAAVISGTPIDFEMSGTLIVDILSASSLGFDIEGNLHVAGGDFAISKVDFLAIVRSVAVETALTGGGSADINDVTQVRRLDPDTANTSNFYSARYNPQHQELFVHSAGASQVFVYRDPAAPVPAVSTWGAAMLTLLLMIVATLRIEKSGSKLHDMNHPNGVR